MIQKPKFRSKIHGNKYYSTEVVKKIKCKKCGRVQVKARNWDYQKCENIECDNYLYDYRVL